MYSVGFAAAILHNGKPLREQGDTVAVPDGSTYTILLKNTSPVQRCAVSVAVGGINATEGVKLVIKPNSSIELKRFIRNGNMQDGEAFVFKASSSIELIKNILQLMPDGINLLSKPLATDDLLKQAADSNKVSIMYEFEQLQGMAAQASDDVLTWQEMATRGEMKRANPKVVQPFNITQSFKTATKQTITIKLVAQEQAVYSRDKFTCSKCNNKERTSAKFCSQCGTSLQLN